MIDLPPPQDYWLTEPEREEAAAKIKTILQRLDTVKQELARRMIGDDIYERAEARMHLGEDETFCAPAEAAEQFAALDREKGVRRVHDSLLLEPATQAEADIKIQLEMWARELFPDDTMLSILDQPEKLFQLASTLKTVEAQSELDNDDAIKTQFNVERYLDGVVTYLYKQAKGAGSEHIEEIWIDEHTVHVVFFGDESRSTESIDDTTILIRDGDITFDRLPISTASQQKAVEDILQPLPAIAQSLESGLKDYVVQGFRG